MTQKESELLKQELIIQLGGKLDGSEKNIVSDCPFCHKKGKFGVYVGKETARKKPFSSHCFSCGKSFRDIDFFLKAIGRHDLVIGETTDIKKELDFKLETEYEEDEIDTELVEVDLPDAYKRMYKHRYLQKRGFTIDDFEYFPVGTTRGFNFKFNDYVIFPIIENEVCVGYVSRHVWSKKEIEIYNKNAKKEGKFQINRYKNSTENDFVKLLYNIDSVIEGETKTVILLEGIIDVIALTRKLEMYDNTYAVPVATFGKKISNVQMLKLQEKGVRNIIIGYDGDAVNTIKDIANQLKPYFEVYICDIKDPEQDMDSLDYWSIYDIFAFDLKTPIEYNLNKIQGF